MVWIMKLIFFLATTLWELPEIEDEQQVIYLWYSVGIVKNSFYQG